MTTFADTPSPTVHDVEGLTDDALRDLFAYTDDVAGPRLRANFIASIDGAVTLAGSGRKLGTPTDRRVFRRLRDVADVVLVGATTATAKPYVDMQLTPDAQTWRIAHGLAATLPVAVVSSRGVVPPALLDNPFAPPVVLVSAEADASCRQALEDSGARVMVLPGHRISSAAVRAALAEVGLNRVLVEGGPTLFSQLVSDDAIDELCITTSPMMVAGPARRIASSAAHVEIGMGRRCVLLGGDGTVIVQWVRS
ncbi:dihydrofolate reductase family protein [Mycolicibacterium sp. S2-37]|uniref:dihydrofolate reductase family protein n=1 Tax=Mycolicibacterium sp. S2-37 TaxID=2810297 RepID=UPI001A93FCCD|nr:dihydrofolate reductase family protein [Mycolicibacterium sp. S2-37]MBO0679116.1 dihydrofolate reductase family protein [Mycolicibacterium sp. S2-37]